MSRLINLTCILILMSFTVNVLCIKCWNCRSDTDPKCANPFDNSALPIKDCNQGQGFGILSEVKPTMCSKISRIINGEWLVSRDCAYLGKVGIQGDERLCLMKTDTDNILTEYCTCNNEDGCNSSGTIGPLSITMLISLICVYINFLN